MFADISRTTERAGVEGEVGEVGLSGSIGIGATPEDSRIGNAGEETQSPGLVRITVKHDVAGIQRAIREAGGLRGGTVKSSVGLGMLLMDGIGDTIRISLAADPVEEVMVGFEILKSLKLRSNGINFIACPNSELRPGPPSPTTSSIGSNACMRTRTGSSPDRSPLMRTICSSPWVSSV